jgi:nicotinamide-nucleotide amidase
MSGMFSKVLMADGRNLLALCKKRGIMLATAESCTGGLIAALLTEIPGSSAVVERGFVTYSNEAKQSLLGVPQAALKRYGAVSKEVVKAMAEGALEHSDAKLSVAVTGIAGPEGGTEKKPVGLVYIAAAFSKHKTVIEECHFKGNRRTIRLAAVGLALRLALKQIREH